MTIISSTGNAISGGNNIGTRQFVFEILDFLRQPSPTGPGWTIPQSSDGSTVDTGGLGANITGIADLNQFNSGVSESWFVLRSPDGAKELLFNRATTDADRWDVIYSATASFAPGTIAVQPAAPDGRTANGHNTFADPNVASTVHLTADDAAPYGWAAYCHSGGLPLTEFGAVAFIPITDTQPGETDPYCYYNGAFRDGFLEASLRKESAAFNTTRVMGHVPGTTSYVAMPAIALVGSSSNKLFPNGCPVDSNSADISMPCPIGRRSTLSAPNGFKGFTTFMQWNGVIRSPLETFAGLTRISFGDVNFPWDGSTVPIP